MSEDWLKDPAEERKLAVEQQKIKMRLKTDLDEMRQIVSTKIGRRFIWNLLCECGIFQSSFDGSSRTFFKEGERNVGLKILTKLHDAHPEAYGTMVKESKGGEYDV